MMETETMGRVTTELLVENFNDVCNAELGKILPEAVRRVMVADGLVDTGATLFSLPSSIIRELGLLRFATRRVRTSNGTCESGLYGAVRLTIQGRECLVDALEVPDGTPVLVGQIPLEHLDFVVDMRTKTLVGNPAHGGEHMCELY